MRVSISSSLLSAALLVSEGCDANEAGGASPTVIVDCPRVDAPRIVATVDSLWIGRPVALGTTLFALGETGDLLSIDVSDPAEPEVRTALSTEALEVDRLEVVGEHLVALGNKTWIYAVDEEGLSMVSRIDAGPGGAHVAVAGTQLVWGGHRSAFVDLAVPSDPVLVTDFMTQVDPSTESITAVWAAEDLFVIASGGALRILRAGSGDLPALRGEWTGPAVRHASAYEDHVFVLHDESEGGAALLTLAPGPEGAYDEVARLDTVRFVIAMEVVGDTVVLLREDHLFAIDVSDPRMPAEVERTPLYEGAGHSALGGGPFVAGPYALVPHRDGLDLWTLCGGEPPA